MAKYTIGLDFGTLSARAVVVDVASGEVLSAQEHPYAHGVISKKMPCGTPLPDGWALQDPRDYLESLEIAVTKAVKQSGVDAQDIIGLGVDFTASTTLPVLKDGTPVCFLPEYARNPHAYVKLWKHHGAQRQANEMTRIAKARSEVWLKNYGGKINSEWSYPKLWELLQEAPDVYDLMDEWIEAGDWIVFQLTGRRTRGAGFAGCKSFYDARRGYPEEDFFATLDERLRHVIRDKHAWPILEIGANAGTLLPKMAEKLGLPENVAVTTANCDGHVCGPAVNVTHAGQMMLVIGTSTGLHALGDGDALDIPGICGSVRNGMIPGLISYEMGQSCVGDLFAWFADHCVPESYRRTAEEKGITVQQYLTELADKLQPGENGLMALEWWNGNRSILVDSDLSGLLVGMTLQTRAEDIYRALIEATAFGIRVIVENNRKHGLRVDEIIASGGISQKNPMLMQIYADVLNMPIHVTATKQGPALGSAIMAAVAAGEQNGGYTSITEAAERMHAPEMGIYEPHAEHSKQYDEMYRDYCMLQAYFGQGGNNIMKRMLQRKNSYHQDRANLPAALVEIQNYLDEHYQEIASVSDLAAHFFYTREYVSRLFRKYLNITVAEYIIRLRIQQGCRLLKTDASIADVCFKTGFQSIASFNRAFKRIIGVTPSVYRQECI
ncbi:MAG: ribulokinase [Clostridia bacterium]|nr:ribulokinase [Clostridia bacterium]